MKALESEKISGSQFMWLLVATVLPTSLLFIPAVTIEKAGTSAWIDGLVVETIWGIAVVWVCSTLGERFPGRSLVDYSGDILGKVLSKLVGIFYIFIFSYVNAIMVREFGEFMVTAFMPETPLLVFNIFLIGLAALAVRNGIEVIARMNQFVISLMIFALIFIFVLVVQEAELNHLLPFLEGGIKPLMRGALMPMGWQGEVFLLVFLLPYLNNHREAKIAGIKAVILLGLALGIDIGMVLAVFGKAASNYVFPVHVLSSYISVAGFLERVEAFVLALWVGGVMIKVSVWYYCLTLVTAQTFGLEDNKSLVLPLGVIQAVWSITIFNNFREMVDFFVKPWVTFSLFFEFIVPATLLLIAVVRKRGGQSG